MKFCKMVTVLELGAIAMTVISLDEEADPYKLHDDLPHSSYIYQHPVDSEVVISGTTETLRVHVTESINFSEDNSIAVI